MYSALPHPGKGDHRAVIRLRLDNDGAVILKLWCGLLDYATAYADGLLDYVTAYADGLLRYATAYADGLLDYATAYADGLLDYATAYADGRLTFTFKNGSSFEG